MMRRAFLYGLLLLQTLVLLPVAILPVNRYELIDPGTSTPPDPDTVLVVYAALALFALAIPAILALVHAYGKWERGIVYGLVAATSLGIVLARVIT